ncbi:MAG TPA: HIT domain-containing protein [bacterium]|nr:HIT domain-containing protein [bacterium]
MDRIWAPWRIQYILGMDDGKKEAGKKNHGCVLCANHEADPENDRKNLVLHRGEHSYIMMNLYPYNSGHLMFVPYKHTGDFGALACETVAEMMALTQKMIPVIGETMSPHGFNIGMNLGRVAGAGIVDHVHLHLVPRWNGDCNFMPVLSDTKVISEHIEATYDRLKKAISGTDL